MDVVSCHPFKNNMTPVKVTQWTIHIIQPGYGFLMGEISLRCFYSNEIRPGIGLGMAVPFYHYALGTSAMTILFMSVPVNVLLTIAIPSTLLPSHFSP